MLGSAVFRTGAAPGGALAGPWVRNPLWTAARAVPSLDLRFADNKSLVDAATGQNLVTFTRASSGTYVDSQGVIRTATTNLLLRSEEFDSASWGNQGTAPTVTANAAIAPNGTNTADRITFAAADSRRTQSNLPIVSGASYTISIYALAVGASNNKFRFNFFDQSVSFTSADVIVSSSTWQRYSYTFTSTQTNNSGFLTFRNASDNAANDIYFWGAQLEQSSTVGEYIPTTSTINSAPRFDHNPTTGESLGLLVEESRTNSIRNNTMVGVVAGTPGTLPTNWQVSNTAGLATNIIASGTDDGISYVDVQVVGTTTGNTYSINPELGGIVAANSTQSWSSSAYIKRVSGSATNISSILVGWAEQNSVPAFLAFNIGAVTVTGTGRLAENRKSYSAAVSQANTAFLRPVISISFPSGAAIDITLRIGMPQLEQGAFPTSVIPTTTAAVTRSADVASITGSNFGTTRTNLLVRSEEFDNASWAKLNNVTVTANATTAPNGFITADKIVEPASSADKPIVQSVTLIANTTYTASVYFKAAERPTILFHVRKSDYSTRFGGFFNTSTNVFTAETSGGGVLDSFTFTNVGGGWYRCSITGNIGANTAGIVTIYLANSSNNLTYTGDGTSGLFLWGAQLEVGAAVTPYIQSPSVFVSRASSGTYIGGNGVLQTATTNLLLRSEEFDNASWATLNATVTANQTIAPNGTLTADQFVENSAGTARLGQVVAATPGVFYTASIYLKAGTNSIINWREDAEDVYGVAVNLATGTITGGSGTIVPVGNDWYRVSFTGSVSGTTFKPEIRAINSPGTIFLWGAQLEQSSTVGEYIPTTSTINSAARYDHDPISLIGKGLLLEESRTNLLLRSEEFQTTWSTTDASISSDSIAAPTGLQTADTYTEGASGTPGIFQTVTGLTASTVYTGSIYIKRGNNDWYRLLFVDNSTFANGARAWINLATGAFGTVENIGTGTGVASSITPLANGWYRVSLSTAMGGTNTVFRFQLNSAASNGSSTRVFNSVTYLWGAQLEAGSFPTSYIPTTTAAVTRAADVSTSVATSVFESSWYRQDEGTVFLSSVGAANIEGGNTRRIVELNNESINERFICGYNGLISSRFLVVDNGVSQADLFVVSGINAGTMINIVAAYKVNDFQQASNGNLSAADSAGTVPTVSQVQIGTGGSASTTLNGTIRRLTYFPVRLANEVLQRITQ